MPIFTSSHTRLLGYAGICLLSRASPTEPQLGTSRSPGNPALLLLPSCETVGLVGPHNQQHPAIPAGLPVLRQHITHSDQITSLSLFLSLRPLSLPGWNLHRLTHQSGSFRRFLFAGALLPLGAQLLNLLSEGSDQSFQMAHTALQAAEVRRRCRHSGERREPVF